MLWYFLEKVQAKSMSVLEFYVGYFGNFSAPSNRDSINFTLC